MTIGKADQNEHAVYPARTNAEKPPLKFKARDACAFQNIAQTRSKRQPSPPQRTR